MYEKDGAKANPIRLDGLNSIDSEVIGKHVINLYLKWEPANDNTDQKIGSLYGFDLHIRQQREGYEEKGLFEYRYYNSFYAKHPNGEIKYTFNQGHPTADNPKLAARHFLNALDRIPKLKEQYEKNQNELNNDISVLEKLIIKPFEKEEELKLLKQELQTLEREISLKIQENQMKQHEGKEVKHEATIINMKTDKLLTKKELPEKRRGLRL
jgi:hypothetical protein